jgi:hypothetical protein
MRVSCVFFVCSFLFLAFVEASDDVTKTETNSVDTGTVAEKKEAITSEAKTDTLEPIQTLSHAVAGAKKAHAKKPNRAAKSHVKKTSRAKKTGQAVSSFKADRNLLKFSTPSTSHPTKRVPNLQLTNRPTRKVPLVLRKQRSRRQSTMLKSLMVKLLLNRMVSPQLPTRSRTALAA